MRRPAKKRKPEYQKRILDAYRAGKLPTGGAHILDIYHDDWCAFFSGGACNCDPEIKIRLLGHSETGEDKAKG